MWSIPTVSGLRGFYRVQKRIRKPLVNPGPGTAFVARILRSVAYHALEEHCKLLDAKFSGCPDCESLPSFPDETGKAVDKAKVFTLIEHVVTLMGLPIMSDGGKTLYGGHSLRVSGAQWMAKSGVPLPLIQLMARWSSNAIARYVADTPLETISEVYRRAAAAKDLSEMVSDAKRSNEAAQRELVNMRAVFRDSFLEEVRASAAVGESHRVAPSVSPPYVLKCGGGKVHIVANRAVNVLPVFEWRSLCGWKFGLSNFAFTSHRGPAEGLCAACFKGRGLDASDQSSSE